MSHQKPTWTWTWDEISRSYWRNVLIPGGSYQWTTEWSKPTTQPDTQNQLPPLANNLDYANTYPSHDHRRMDSVHGVSQINSFFPPPQPTYGFSPSFQSPPLEQNPTHQTSFSPSHHAQRQPASPNYSIPVLSDSVQPQTRGRGQNAAKLQGKTVVGSYNPQNLLKPGLHYETLDPSYYVRPKSFFKQGKVFAIIFTEPAGDTTTEYNSSISTVLFGQQVHTQVRRFIVVRPKLEFCYACPIFTYGGKGTMKPGVRPEEHAIAYSYGSQPKYLSHELQLGMKAIPVNSKPDAILHEASRIYFGIHHPVQYNVKVKDMGDVFDSHVPALIGYWKMVDQQGTNQPIEVTANENEKGDEDSYSTGTIQPYYQ